MNVSCPACGAEMTLDVLLTHQETREAFARLCKQGIALGAVVLRYLRLFKPATRALSISRTVTLLEELLPDIERGAITRKGRDWDVSRDTWIEAIDVVIRQRDLGKLTTPLSGHGYLLEVMCDMADKHERDAESRREAERRTRSVEGPDTGLQAPFSSPVVLAPQDATPSLYARKLRAAIEAKTLMQPQGASDA